MEMLATRVLALGISTPLVMLITAQAAQAQEYLAREAASARKHHAAPEAYDAQALSSLRMLIDYAKPQHLSEFDSLHDRPHRLL